MASKRTREWARIAVIVSLAAMVGCMKDKGGSGPSSSGAGAPSPLNWNQATGPSISGGTFDTPLLWVDPNLNIGGTGGGGTVISMDDRTYLTPVEYIVPVAQKVHPLQTSTGSLAITTPEDTLSGMLNGYRQQVLGIGGGGGFIGGGIPIGGTTGVLVPMHSTARKVARAHCKHYSRYVPNTPLPFQNEEGDQSSTASPGAQPLNNPPNPPRPGRLAKCGITYGSHNSYNISGLAYATPDAARDWFIQNSPVTATWTHWGIGYFIGGTEQHYWNVTFLGNPIPAN